MKLEPALVAKIESLIADKSTSKVARDALRAVLKVNATPSPAGRPGISEEKKQGIVDDHHAGIPRAESAAKRGVAKSTVTKVLVAAGLAKLRKKRGKTDHTS